MVTATQPSLIEKMGGIAAASGVLISAVEIFYAKLVGDPRLAPFFVDVDIEKLKKKQVEFLAYVFGGPSAYTGKDLYAAHEHLIRDQGLNETHFDMVAEHFRQTLVELHVDEALVQEALAILATSRPIFQAKQTPQTAAMHSCALASPAVSAQIATLQQQQQQQQQQEEDKLACVVAQLQVLLQNRNAEVAAVKQAVHELVANTKPSRLQRVRAALHSKGNGLAELFDEAMLT